LVSSLKIGRLTSLVVSRVATMALIGASLIGLSACGTSAHPTVLVLPTATNLAVILTTDRPLYHVAQPIGVNIQNQSASAYYALDNHSSCTVVQLQERLQGSWVDVMPCSAGAQGHALEIAPKLSFPLTLAPGNAPDNANAWQPGVYRLALTYGTKADGSGATALCFSVGFQVTA
jgi:hypothetical protein